DCFRPQSGVIFAFTNKDSVFSSVNADDIKRSFFTAHLNPSPLSGAEVFHAWMTANQKTVEQRILMGTGFPAKFFQSGSELRLHLCVKGRICGDFDKLSFYNH